MFEVAMCWIVKSFHPVIWTKSENYFLFPSDVWSYVYTSKTDIEWKRFTLLTCLVEIVAVSNAFLNSNQVFTRERRSTLKRQIGAGCNCNLQRSLIVLHSNNLEVGLFPMFTMWIDNILEMDDYETRWLSTFAKFAFGWKLQRWRKCIFLRVG